MEVYVYLYKVIFEVSRIITRPHTMIRNIAVLLMVALTAVHGGKVLAILGTDLRSHFQVMSTVVNLIAQHHNVTFYLPPEFIYHNPNITMKKVDGPNRFFDFSVGTILEQACNYDTYSLFYKYILTDNYTYFNTLFEGKDVKELLNDKEKYDLLVMSGYGAEHFVKVAHTMKIPVVQVVPSLLFPWHNEHINSPHSWISDFSFMVNDMPHTFWGRLNLFIKNAGIWHRYKNHHIPIIEQVTKKYFPAGTPSVEKMLGKTDLILVNTRTVMGYTRPSVQTVVEIGGVHCEPAKKLPKEIEDFIESSGEHGFVYFSLGTVVQGFAMPDYIKSAILNAFARIPQKVLWKWNGEMENLPSNVKIIKWAPQQDILGHKKIKLFITQGGMLSMQESVYHAVPVLVIPVIFDQYTNGYVAQEKGYGRTINFCKFTERKLYEVIREMTENPKYSNTIKGLSLILKDQIESTKAKINWWIEFVIRHNGTSELRPLDRHKSWVTHVPFDVIAFMIFILMIMLLLAMLFMGYSYVKIKDYILEKHLMKVKSQ